MVTINIDPDNIIKRYQLGYVTSSIDELILTIKTLFNDPTLRKYFGENGLNYVNHEHYTETISGQYLKLLKRII